MEKITNILVIIATIVTFGLLLNPTPLNICLFIWFTIMNFRHIKIMIKNKTY